MNSEWARMKLVHVCNPKGGPKPVQNSPVGNLNAHEEYCADKLRNRPQHRVDLRLNPSQIEALVMQEKAAISELTEKDVELRIARSFTVAEDSVHCTYLIQRARIVLKRDSSEYLCHLRQKSHCLTDQPPIDGVYEVKRIDRKEQDAVSSPQILLQSSPDRMQEAIVRFALFRPFKNRWHLDAEQLQTSLPSRGR